MGEQLAFMQTMDCGAVLSKCRTYRYQLWRKWGDGGMVNFVMLNPSTADETEDDPTIRRCVAFAKSWGYDGLMVTNLYALRATDPREIVRHDSPVGEANDAWLTETAERADLVVFAWGVHGGRRGREVSRLLAHRDPKCLGTTKDGSPRHPLYLRKDTALEPAARVPQEEEQSE